MAYYCVLEFFSENQMCISGTLGMTCKANFIVGLLNRDFLPEFNRMVKMYLFTVCAMNEHSKVKIEILVL